MPGDVITDRFLVECKLRASGGKKQIAIEKAWLTKIEKEARSQNKIPLLIFKYKNDKSYYAILNLKDFISLSLEPKLMKGGLKDEERLEYHKGTLG